MAEKKYNTLLTIKSNIPSNEEPVITLWSNTKVAPFLTLSADTISMHLSTGDRQIAKLFIDNTLGGSALYYHLTGSSQQLQEKLYTYFALPKLLTTYAITGFNKFADSLQIFIQLKGNYVNPLVDTSSIIIEGTKFSPIKYKAPSSYISDQYFFKNNDNYKWFADDTLNIAISSTPTVIKNNNIIHEIRLRTYKKSWHTVFNQNDTVPKHENDSIEIEFNAKYLPTGIYLSHLIIQSNDPITPTDTITLKLEVDGCPVLSLPKDSFQFGKVYANYPKTIDIIIKNEGTDSLDISNIASSNSIFKLNESALKIAPFDTKYLKVEYAPIKDSSDSCVISFDSNDQKNKFKEIRMSGFGVMPPQMGISSDSISINISEIDSILQRIIIDNTYGGSQLKFQIWGEKVDTVVIKNDKAIFRLMGTHHEFNDIPTNFKFVKLEIVPDSWYSDYPENIRLYIEGQDYGKVSLYNPNSKNYLSTFTISKDSISNWMKDGSISMDVINFGFVSYNRTILHQLKLKFIGNSWIPSLNITDSIQAGNSDTISIWFNAKDKKAGSYHSHYLVKSNDPSTNLSRISVNMNVNNPSINVATKTLNFEMGINDTIAYPLIISNENALSQLSYKIIQYSGTDTTVPLNSKNVL